MADSSSLANKMDIDEAAIDEGLYSRQLWVNKHYQRFDNLSSIRFQLCTGTRR